MNRIKILREEKNITQEELAKLLGMSKGIISLYEKEKRKPSLEILLKLSNIFQCSMDYIIGTSNIKNTNIRPPQTALEAFTLLVSFEKNETNLKRILNNFGYYCNYLNTNLPFVLDGFSNSNKTIYNFSDEYNFEKFYILYNGLIEQLKKRDFFATFINLNDLQEKKYILLPNTIDTFFISINRKNINTALDIINSYSEQLNELKKSYFLNEAQKNSDETISSKNSQFTLNKDTFQKVPIVGKITAGQPILAEEYLEGYLPVDPNIYGVSTTEDLFYLRVSGQSMNLKVKNGDYALIKKQDYAEDGDIVVAIVNGDDEATLKRYKKLNDQFVLLEPMSSDPSIEAITVDLKTTEFKIIGKAIGQFGKF